MKKGNHLREIMLGESVIYGKEMYVDILNKLCNISSDILNGL